MSLPTQWSVLVYSLFKVKRGGKIRSAGLTHYAFGSLPCLNLVSISVYQAIWSLDIGKPSIANVSNVKLFDFNSKNH